MALLADAGVYAQEGSCGMLCTVVAERGVPEGSDGDDMVAMTVDYKEKSFARGVITSHNPDRNDKPMPNHEEILVSRIIDRSVRPSIDPTLKSALDVKVTLLSNDPRVAPEVPAINGASAALAVSGLPYENPVAAVRIATINGEFVVDPSRPEIEKSQLNLVYAGTRDAAMMVELQADHAEARVVEDALRRAQKSVAKRIKAIEKLRDNVAKKPIQTARLEPPRDALVSEARALCRDKFLQLYSEPQEGRMAREQSLARVRDAAVEELCSRYGCAQGNSEGLEKKKSGEDEINEGTIRGAVKLVETTVMREMAIESGKRVDGRSVDEVRPLRAEVGVLPNTVHGSALFSRGDTQVLCAATLAHPALTGTDSRYNAPAVKDRLYVQYEFPSYATNEIGKPGQRREVGHGMLTKRALQTTVPVSRNLITQADITLSGGGGFEPISEPAITADDIENGGFGDYTYRLHSITMGSNGSSSMASVCAGCLALSHAGVQTPFGFVGGISMGLATLVDETAENGLRYAILTDILGYEDYLGDMDFKIAGTNGLITAAQLDVKLRGGVPLEILIEALGKSAGARDKIINCMAEAAVKANIDLSGHGNSVPSVKPRDKNLIPMGEVYPLRTHDHALLTAARRKLFRFITNMTQCVVEFTPDGTSLQIFGLRKDRLTARKIIQQVTGDIHVGRDYDVRAVNIEDYGVFVQIAETIGKNTAGKKGARFPFVGEQASDRLGFIHADQLAKGGIDNPADVVKRGEIFSARCIGHEASGRPILSVASLGEVENRGY